MRESEELRLPWPLLVSFQAQAICLADWIAESTALHIEKEYVSLSDALGRATRRDRCGVSTQLSSFPSPLPLRNTYLQATPSLAGEPQTAHSLALIVFFSPTFRTFKLHLDA